MAQTLARHAQRFHIGKLDFTRISAEAGAIAINGVALLLLLVPLSMYVPPQEQREPDLIFVSQTPRKPPDPIVKPKEVEVTKPHPMPTTSTIVQQKIELQPIPIVDPQPADLAAEPVQIAKANIGLGNTITEPLAGSHLEYEVAPPPPYPVTAIREALTGTVTLRVLVGVDGKPIEVQIERSSGHRVLDVAARKQVLAKWRFKPAMQDGQPVQAIGLVPVVFNLYQ